MTSRYGEQDTTLDNKARQLSLIPGCARCGERNVPVAIVVFAAGYETTYCPRCVGKL